MRWDTALLLTHVVSDALIALAYFSIPAALVTFVRRRKDLRFGIIFWLFSAFIFWCGITHVAAIVTMWVPDYWLEGWTKVVTALVSVTTAAVLWTIIPKALRIPSPRQLEEANANLLDANARLEEAGKRSNHLAEAAQQSERAKGEFLAVMSHEIRTPLNAMLGMSSLLASTSLTPNQRDYLETIQNSGETLLGLLTDILDYSKLDANLVELDPVPCNTVDVAASCLGQIADMAESKGLNVGLIVEGDVPVRVKADVVRLRQMLLNLLTNASKFTDAGEIVLRISPGKTAGTSCEVIFEISDTGIGISEDKMEMLFEPFSQADLSPTRLYGGAGLGLIISRRIAQVMQGGITVESRPGEGSTFRASVVLEAVPDEKPSGCKVVVVTDRPIVQKTLQSIIEHLGGSVTICRTAGAARDASGRADFVIVDHALEGEAVTVLGAVGTASCYLLIPFNRSWLRCDARGFADTLRYPPQMEMLRKVVCRPALDFIAAPAEPPSRGGFDATLSHGNPLRILVAEDNFTNQRIFQLILEKMGYQPKIASNGIAAVTEWAASPYDLVLMDLHMPELDGIGATDSIRKREASSKRPRCRIVAITADARAETVQECIDKGMDACLTKPVSPRALSEILKSTRQLPI